MPTEVIMPKVDMDMASGKIAVWHIAPGESVQKGEPLFDIETDKAAMEVEAPDSGILHHPAPEGSEIPIGKPVAWLYAEGEEVGDPPQPFETISDASGAPVADTPPAAGEDRPEPQETGDEPEPLAAVAVSGDKTRATPKARALARDGGMDVADIPGTGPRGRVQAEDVRNALKGGFAASTPVRFSPETGPLAVSRSKGGKGAPLVLIHGFASDATSWAPLEAQFRDRPIIRIDLPGHGKSPKLRIPNFVTLLKEVRRAVDDLQLDEMHLVGHSLGGAVCLALADTRPRNIASLTLIAPAGLGPDMNGAALGGICKASRAESLGPWLKSLVADDRIVTDSYVRLAMTARSDANLRAAQAAMSDALFPDGVQSFDLRAALDGVQMPTRLIWGRQDEIIPWKHALRAPGRVGLHLFDGVGHMPQLEAAEEVGKILRSQL